VNKTLALVMKILGNNLITDSWLSCFYRSFAYLLHKLSDSRLHVHKNTKTCTKVICSQSHKPFTTANQSKSYWLPAVSLVSFSS